MSQQLEGFSVDSSSSKQDKSSLGMMTQRPIMKQEKLRTGNVVQDYYQTIVRLVL
jgi:hypothetical protein